MEYKIAEKKDKEIFNGFVAGFYSGDLMQSFEWGDLKSKSGWKPVRIYAEENNKIVAAASILFRKIPKINKTIAYVSRGPVLDTQNKILVDGFTEFMKTIAIRNNAILIKIDPPVLIDDKTSEQNIINAGFKHISLSGFGGTQPKCVMQLDLQKSHEELLSSFKPKWRYNIKLAEKKGVLVNINCNREQLPVFYNLLKETCKRDGFLVRSLNYFEDMWDCLVPSGYMKLVLTYLDDKPIAGAITFIFGDKAMYTYGASSNEHRNVMPNHLMQWELIKWANENGCKWYDFRGVSPKKDMSSDSHLSGLNRFKEGFSPRFVEYLGEYDLIISSVYCWLWNFAMPRVRGILKKRNNHLSD